MQEERGGETNMFRNRGSILGGMKDEQIMAAKVLYGWRAYYIKKAIELFETFVPTRNEGGVV